MYYYFQYYQQARTFCVVHEGARIVGEPYGVRGIYSVLCAIHLRQ